MEKKFYKNNSNYKGLIICKEKTQLGFYYIIYVPTIVVVLILNFY